MNKCCTPKRTSLLILLCEIWLFVVCCPSGTSGQDVAEQAELVLQRLRSSNVTDHFPDFHRYIYDDYRRPMYRIRNGGDDMYRYDGNEVYFAVNDESTYAAYNESYNGTGYSFSTLAIHPFTAFFYIDSSDEKTFSIQVRSRLGGYYTSYNRISQDFSGSVSTDDYEMSFRGVQAFEKLSPSVCEVYFHIVKSGSNADFVFVPPYDNYNYWDNRAWVTASGSERVFGYTLFSTLDPGRELSETELETAMLDVLSTITTGKGISTRNVTQSSNADMDREMKIILDRLVSVSLTNHLTDFFPYQYDDVSFPINHIQNGGSMFYKGNYIQFTVDEDRYFAEYNRSYNGSDYSFATLAIHPFTAFFYINTTDETRSFAIAVLAANRYGSLTSTVDGSATYEDYVISFRAHQFFEGVSPSVCEVFFYIVKDQSDIEIVYNPPVDRNGRNEATISGNLQNVVFGYTLLSTWTPGREITKTQLEKIMLDFLTIITNGSASEVIYTTQDIEMTRETEVLQQRLRSFDVTTSLVDFYHYEYDDTTYPINKIDNGGENMFRQGNYIMCTANDESFFAEYDKTYNGSGYTFSTLAIHPFISFFFINGTNQTQQTYSIEVWSQLSRQSLVSLFEGSVSNDDNHAIVFRGFQAYEGFSPSVCEVFFYVSKNQSDLQLTYTPKNLWEWKSTATLQGNPQNVVFGYTLLSTLNPGREITQVELVATMRNMLDTITTGTVSSSNITRNEEIVQEMEIFAERLQSSSLLSHIKDIHQYVYDDHSYPINQIVDGGQNMYNGGNFVIFSANGQATLAEYDKMYNGSTYSFLTMTIHPFTAFFYINSTVEETYSIEVLSRPGGGGRISLFDGSVSDGDHQLTFRGTQTFQGYSASLCEVFFVLSRTQHALNFTFADSTTINRRVEATLTGIASEVVFGYTLMSTQDPGREITQTQLETAMLAMLKAVTTGAISTQQQQNSSVFEETKVIMERLESAGFTRHLRDFYAYRYDDYSSPINHINDGGNNMYDRGNYILFNGNGDSSYAEYDQIYNGSDFAFATLALHPFIGFFYINSTEQNIQNYSIEVWSRTGVWSWSNNQDFAGSVSSEDYILSFKGNQIYEENNPSICEVFFFISKEITGIDFQFANLQDGWEKRSQAALQGNPKDVVFGYLLLSTLYPGREVTQFQLETIMSDVLSVITTGNGSAANKTVDLDISRETNITLDRLKASKFTRHLTDFYFYNYDDYSNPTYKISDGGENMYDNGNIVYFDANGDASVAEYNTTYYGKDFSFSTIAIHPFTAFFVINTTEQTTKHYSIEVRSRTGARSYGIHEFAGAVSFGEYILSFRGNQLFEAFNPSICEVFFFISKDENGTELRLSTRQQYYDRRSEAILHGNPKNAVFGYILLSTLYPGREVTQLQLETTMRDVLQTITTGQGITIDEQADSYISRTTNTTLQYLSRSNLLRYLGDFYYYNYDDYSDPAYMIRDGGNNMYDNGNIVYFDANGENSLAKYNKTYFGADFSFSTLAIHPFTAFFVINGTEETMRTYTIQVWSRGSRNGRTEALSGTVTLDGHTMFFSGVQFAEGFVPSIVEIFFYVAKNESQLDWTVSPSYSTYQRVSNATLNGSAQHHVIFGYTLLSTAKPGRLLRQEQLQLIMVDFLATILTGNVNIEQPSVFEDVEKTEFLKQSLRSSDLTKHVKDFHHYAYDDISTPLDSITNGGDNMFSDGNYVYFTAHEKTTLVEYNRIYNGSDYSFCALAIHPFIAFFYINSTDSVQKNYYIQVVSRLGSTRHTNEFAGSVTYQGLELTFKGVQYFGAFVPAVCEVFFFVAKNGSELEFQFSQDWSWHRQNEALLTGSPQDTVFGYTLLSTLKPGRAITKTQLDETMLEMLITIATGNGTTTLPQILSQVVARRTDDLIKNLTSTSLTKHVSNFFRYRYDDFTKPINNIVRGGRDMFWDGNFVYFAANGCENLAEYGKTYNGSGYSFTSLTTHPFTAFFYINPEEQTSANYSIRVWSRQYYYYYYRRNHLHFSGSVSSGNQMLSFSGVQVYEAYQPSVCQVYFYIAQQKENELQFNVSSSLNEYYYNGEWQSEGNLQGNVKNVIFGYTLLSTFPSREITQEELESTMIGMLETMSGDENKAEASVTVEGFPGTHVVFLRITKKAVPTSMRTYSISVNGGGSSFSTTALDVDTLLLTDLSPETTYTIAVSVLDNGLLNATVTLTVATLPSCTLQCTNGHCVAPSPGSTECVCKPGYEKHTNHTHVCLDVDECQLTPSPCPVNSTCSNSDGSYVCRCRGGLQFFGGECVGTDICNKKPCDNGGICLSTDGTFSCDCAQYYFGTRCEYYASPCLGVPCLNGGTCIDLRGSYRCNCTENYQGVTCSEDVDECKLGMFECDPNSDCRNTNGSYECVCREGYRGDGKEKCYFIRLLAYGEAEGDEILTIGDDVASPTIRASFEIPFAIKAYRDMHVTSNGLISLGPDSWFVQYLYYPWYNGFHYHDVALIAPFWDNFQPNANNDGRVYYQVYDKGDATLTNKSEAVVQKVGNLINEHFHRDDFEPLFVLKATWSEVVMYPEYYNRNYPSTFQAIIASDGTDTYLIYNYKEDAMLWDTRKRYYWGNRALIGYSFALGHDHVETQGDYRPDLRNQTAGGPTGQYYYHVASARNNEAKARKECRAWVEREKKNPWKTEYEPCPCNSLQARIDTRFTWSVDVELYWNEYYNRYWPGHHRTASLAEWAYEEVGLYNCYQLRQNTGPRCCYSPRSTTFSRFWGWWSQAPIISGPFSSRYERDPIPVFQRNPWWSWVSNRDEELFQSQYNRSMNNDLVPRRHCCVESNDQQLCDKYQTLRPPATCSGYIPRRIMFFWGDPHITTSDGVTYSFNGLGEYYMVYAPGVFVLQARTKKAKKEDMTDSDATVFVAFVAKDLSSNTTGTVQFEVDFANNNGNGVIIKIDGIIVQNISDTLTIVKEVSLSVDNGTYTATFPSSNSLSITASNFLLTMQFTGDTATLQNNSQGLMGYWDEIKENDFRMRNGTILDWNTLQPTTNLDILNGTLNEKLIYPFGQSWKVRNEEESWFNYSGAYNDTFDFHNPASAPEPPFLEDLVESQRGSSLFEDFRDGCTSNNVLSTPCLYDVLTTNRTEIGESTRTDSESSTQISETNANSLPRINLTESSNLVLANNKYTLLARLDEETKLTVEATDGDGHEVTFSVETENSISGVSIHEKTGVLSWTPTAANQITHPTNKTLIIIATDSLGGETILKLNVKLCICLNNGTCVYENPVLGSENYQIVDCSCTEAYTGSNCSEDRNGCLLSACFSNVTCTDVPAPGVGEDCGDCPEGTTGDGRNCTNIDMCASSPCQHACEPLYNGFTCSCEKGYELVNTTRCLDIDECSSGNPCRSVPHTRCVNTDGDFSCVCDAGFKQTPEGCENINECLDGFHNCSLDTTTCIDVPGSFICSCLPNFTRPDTAEDKTSCADLDECVEGLHNCDMETEDCVNESPSYSCKCKTGLVEINGTCDDIKQCADPTLNNCDNQTSICVDTEEGFNCTCFAGYRKALDGTCVDINECSDDSVCNGNENCVNYVGWYECVCRDGYEKDGTGCKDVDECSNHTICPQGSSCNDLDGGYECICQTGVECTMSPQLEPVAILQISTESVTVTVDSFALYGEYEVKAETVDGTMTNSTNTLVASFATIGGLNPNTVYYISARVVRMKNSSSFDYSANFSRAVQVTTETLKLYMAVTLSSETYEDSLADIVSNSSLTLKSRYESALTNQLTATANGVDLKFLNIQFIAFRNGSVVGSAEGSLNTSNAQHATAKADGAGLNPAQFTNLATMPKIAKPASIRVTEVTTSSIAFEFDRVVGSVRYDVKLTCPTQTVVKTVTTLSVKFTGLTPNDICSGEVRALVDAGSKGVAYSPYSNPVVNSTSPNIPQLSATSVTETSVTLTFGSVSRATSYHVTEASIQPIDLQPSNATNGVLRVQIDNLSQASTYTFTVTVVTNDALGNPRNGIGELKVTTKDRDECHPASGILCPMNSKCNNTFGSYQCVCEPGYTQSAPQGQCNDIDECSQSDICQPFSTCHNIQGSYVCECNDGYHSSITGSECVDIDECQAPSSCPSDAICSNAMGSFECNCGSGYEYDADENTCRGDPEVPDNSDWKIAVGVVGGVLLLALIVIAIVWIARKRGSVYRGM